MKCKVEDAMPRQWKKVVFESSETAREFILNLDGCVLEQEIMTACVMIKDSRLNSTSIADKDIPDYTLGNIIIESKDDGESYIFREYFPPEQRRGLVPVPERRKYSDLKEMLVGRDYL